MVECALQTSFNVKVVDCDSGAAVTTGSVQPVAFLINSPFAQMCSPSGPNSNGIYTMQCTMAKEGPGSMRNDCFNLINTLKDECTEAGRSLQQNEVALNQAKAQVGGHKITIVREQKDGTSSDGTQIVNGQSAQGSQSSKQQTADDEKFSYWGTVKGGVKGALGLPGKVISIMTKWFTSSDGGANGSGNVGISGSGSQTDSTSTQSSADSQKRRDATTTNAVNTELKLSSTTTTTYDNYVEAAALATIALKTRAMQCADLQNKCTMLVPPVGEKMTIGLSVQPTDTWGSGRTSTISVTAGTPSNLEYEVCARKK